MIDDVSILCLRRDVKLLLLVNIKTVNDRQLQDIWLWHDLLKDLIDEEFSWDDLSIIETSSCLSEFLQFIERVPMGRLLTVTVLTSGTN